MIIRQFSNKDTEKIHKLLENFKYSVFLKVSLFNKKNAIEYLLNKIQDFAKKNPQTSYLIEDKNKIKGIILYKKMDWDTKHFGFNIAKIEYFFSEDLPYNESYEIKYNLLKHFNIWCKKENIKFVSIKIDSSDYSSIHALENFGFNYMATLITPILDCRNIKEYKYPVELKKIKASEVKAISNMAEEIFRINRFHLDPRFDKEKANKLHGEWVKNRYKENPDNVYVLRNNNEIIGFYIVTIEDLTKDLGLKLSYLDLAGISTKYKGQGYDAPLFASMINILKNKVDIIYTDFMAENRAIFSVYSKLGFRFVDSKLTMHKWF